MLWQWRWLYYCRYSIYVSAMGVNWGTKCLPSLGISDIPFVGIFVSRLRWDGCDCQRWCMLIAVMCDKGWFHLAYRLFFSACSYSINGYWYWYRWLFGLIDCRRFMPHAVTCTAAEWVDMCHQRVSKRSHRQLDRVQTKRIAIWTSTPYSYAFQCLKANLPSWSVHFFSQFSFCLITSRGLSTKNRHLSVLFLLQIFALRLYQ